MFEVKRKGILPGVSEASERERATEICGWALDI